MKGNGWEGAAGAAGSRSPSGAMPEWRVQADGLRAEHGLGVSQRAEQAAPPQRCENNSLLLIGFKSWCIFLKIRRTVMTHFLDVCCWCSVLQGGSPVEKVLHPPHPPPEEWFPTAF